MIVCKKHQVKINLVKWNLHLYRAIFEGSARCLWRMMMLEDLNWIKFLRTLSHIFREPRAQREELIFSWTCSILVDCWLPDSSTSAVSSSSISTARLKRASTSTSLLSDEFYHPSQRVEMKFFGNFFSPFHFFFHSLVQILHLLLSIVVVSFTLSFSLFHTHSSFAPRDDVRSIPTACRNKTANLWLTLVAAWNNYTKICIHLKHRLRLVLCGRSWPSRIFCFGLNVKNSKDRERIITPSGAINLRSIVWIWI